MTDFAAIGDLREAYLAARETAHEAFDAVMGPAAARMGKAMAQARLIKDQVTRKEIAAYLAAHEQAREVSAAILAGPEADLVRALHPPARNNE